MSSDAATNWAKTDFANDKTACLVYILAWPEITE